MALATLEPDKKARPSEPLSNSGTPKLPPPPGSSEEYAETALAVGYSGAYTMTSDQIMQILISRLLWEM